MIVRYTLKEDKTLYILCNNILCYSNTSYRSNTLNISSMRDNDAKYLCITVYKGFKWNGCSPKIKFFKWFIGTPDGKVINGYPQTYDASMVHDALYTKLRKGKFILSRKECDEIFLYLLKQSNFKFAKLYYFFVRIFGKFFIKK